MRNTSDFIPTGTPALVSSGNFTWTAPSNIALVKYWGKLSHQKNELGLDDSQIPANPSLSFTLKNCHTVTSLQFSLRENTATPFSFELLFEGQPKPEFHPKMEQFFARITPYCPYLKDYHFIISSHNTFPHSSGIASSASGMAALAVNIMSLEQQLYPEMSQEYVQQKASFLARLGSGSACRSIKGSAVVWGETPNIAGSSNQYGISFSGEIHPIFQNYQDTILLVDKGEKQVSSTVGHELMHGHPFAQNRFDQAHEHLAQLKDIFASGNLEQFIALVESEALTLHAMMMCSQPYFILMKPNTLEIIQRIWQFRTRTNTPICFTLDAGANVHVLYPHSHKESCLQFIQAELIGFCQKEQYICDQIGNGAQMIVDC
ncbi:MAG: diphosphomevalonate/mevalonate 3,5-bisphosphate decarboxylase family protein [Flavobacterium psychrophilum]